MPWGPAPPPIRKIIVAYRQSLIAPRFFFDPSADLSKVLHHSAEAVAEADDVRDGWFRVFGQPAGPAGNAARLVGPGAAGR